MSLTNQEITKAIDAEYDTGFRNGWIMCREKIAAMLDGYCDNNHIMGCECSILISLIEKVEEE